MINTFGFKSIFGFKYQETMDCHEYISRMRNIQKILLFYLLREDCIEENYQNFINSISEYKILNDVNTFRALLHLIDGISNNHFRSKEFIGKVEKILINFKDIFSDYLTNSEIFNIFKENKRILYFLFKNKIIYADYYITNIIIKNKKKAYINYFINEIRPFLTEKNIADIENENTKLNIDMDPQVFDHNREIGENDNLICRLIRDDNIDEFITYISQNQISTQISIPVSIFETNYLLIHKNPTLIEYAAFCGSVQIFKYLFKNGGNPQPFIWPYAIHGDNPEILNFLEENNVNFEVKTLRICISEAIKCHHNEIANYFINNYNQFEYDDFINIKSLMFYNFAFFTENLFNRKAFFYLCQYDYFFLVQQILKNKDFVVDYFIKDACYGFDLITTPLNAAIFNDNANVAEILLTNHKIDLNSKTVKCKWSKCEETQSALFYSISCDNLKTLKLLLSQENIDLNMALNSKMYKPNDTYQLMEHYPLMEAISHRNYSLIKMLISHPKININVQKNYQNLSSSDKNSESFKSISSLDMAILMSDAEIINILLSDDKIDPNLISINTSINSESKETPLFVAAKTNKNEIVKILAMNPKVDINKINYVKLKDKKIKETALHYAVRNNLLVVTNALLSSPNIDVNIKSWTFIETKNEEIKSNALYYAIINQNVEIVEILLSNYNIDVNAVSIMDNGVNYEEKSPLFLAVKKSNLEIIKLLLSNENIDVNYCSLSKAKNDSKTSYTSILNAAIANNDIDMIKLLLYFPTIDVNLKSKSHTSDQKLIEDVEVTPIDQAISIGNIEVIKLLLSNSNIDMSLKSKRSSFSQSYFFIEEKTPIQKAISLKNIDIIRFMFAKLTVNDNSILDINELINMTDSEEIKAIIYNGINRLRLK